MLNKILESVFRSAFMSIRVVTGKMQVQAGLQRGGFSGSALCNRKSVPAGVHSHVKHLS